jgi:hypothetical protein
MTQLRLLRERVKLKNKCPAIPPGLGPGPSPDTRVTVSSEDILKDMFEVKKFPLLLQLLIKSMTLNMTQL